MHAPGPIPLRHPFIETRAPGPDALDARAAFFRNLGEWPHAVSALMEAQRLDHRPDRADVLEAARAQWRLADDDLDAGPSLKSLDLKRLLAESRSRDRTEARDLARNAWYLREAHRRYPDERTIRHLLSITYLALLDAEDGIADDPAYDDYLTVDDPAELRARIDHLVDRRRDRPHWVVACPNASGTFQVRDYLRHIETTGRCRLLIDLHKYRKQHFLPIRGPNRKLGWLSFKHLAADTSMPFIVAGNLHDPVQALLYTVTRKSWLARIAPVGPVGSKLLAPVPETVRREIRATVQAAIDTAPPNDLAAYFKVNYADGFGLPLESFQIRHFRHGYFVGFNGRLTLLLTRLPDLEAALPLVLDDILCIETSGLRPPGDFRLHIDPEFSRRLREVMDQIRLPRGFVESSLNTPFMESHFLPAQLQAMRDRWLAQSR